MKRNYLMASMLAAAAMFTGCSEVDEFFTPDTSKTYEASVEASLESVQGIESNEQLSTRAMFIGGNDGNRFANVWDEGDKVLVYQGTTKVGTWSLDDDNNKQYQGTKDAYLSGTLTGTFAVGDQVTLYVTKDDNCVLRDYTGQDGTIGKLSRNYTYRNRTVSITDITGTKIQLDKANMYHSQAYNRYFLTDQEGNRLHIQQLIVSATGDNGIITSVADDGTETYGDLIVNTEINRGEYPGEIYVAILNQGYTVNPETGQVTNGSVEAYQLTAIDDKGITWVFPGPEEHLGGTGEQKALNVKPTPGNLANIQRKMTKVEPTVELGAQMKMVVGTKRTRVPVVKAGETVVPATCTYTSSNYAVASVNASTGEVMALSTGTATITVNIAPYGVSRTYTVTVTESPTEYVDLGLSVNWATMNVGAESETDYGTYFAWGETEGWTSEYDYDKVTFTWDTYKWGDGTTFTKYTTDGLITLEAADDAAVQNWGGNWRMPTIAEFNELATNYPISTQSGTKRSCWGEKNGVNGLFFYDADDNELMFWPAAGYITGSSLSTAGAQGYYSTASLRSNDATNQRLWRMWFSSVALASTNGSTRRSGQTVRAVQPKISASFAKSTLTILPGKERTYRPTVTQSGNDLTSGCTITYSTSNYSVASVKSTTGEVKGISEGTATITATIQPYGITANYEVHVYNSMPATYAVDLGLPSGIKWASMNVGAESETDYGTYFAWGETEGWTSEYDYDKDNFTWGTYKWGNGTTFTKYTTDGLITLEAADDAAVQNWGSNWRMPTLTELEELYDNYPYSTESGSKRCCWGTKNNVGGLFFYDASDNELMFMPAAGCLTNSNLSTAGEQGYYSVASLRSHDETNTRVWRLWFRNGARGTIASANGSTRMTGQPVRAVYVGQ